MHLLLVFVTLKTFHAMFFEKARVKKKPNMHRNIENVYISDIGNKHVLIRKPVADIFHLNYKLSLCDIKDPLVLKYF